MNILTHQKQTMDINVYAKTEYGQSYFGGSSPLTFLKRKEEFENTKRAD